MPLAAFLLALVGPLVGRVLLALGLSVLTIGGMEMVVSELRQAIIQASNSLAADVLALFLISGGGSALGIIMGAINLRVALWVATRATRLVGSGT